MTSLERRTSMMTVDDACESLRNIVKFTCLVLNLFKP